MQKLKAKFRVINFIFYMILISCSIFVILDTFVIEHKSDLTSNSNENEEILNNNDTDDNLNDKMNISDEEENINNSSVATITDNSYEDENISIKISTERTNNTTYYVADISISNSKYLKTALANDTYGRNIKETTSEMAENNNAIFAINGDYYGFRDYGFVIRNGVLYRETANEDNDALVIDNNGNFSIVNESEVNAKELLNERAWQVLSFGPALIEEGDVVVGKNDEVSQAKTSNPRTAIGQIDELHYIVVVADGRTSESEGLSLYELAQVMKNYNCTTAYNLDGGGSSTMYFNGKVINNPTSGRSIGERSVSDIVYIGY